MVSAGSVASRCEPPGAGQSLSSCRSTIQQGTRSTHAHLLNFDSVHGRWHFQASSEGDSIVIDGKRIKVSANKAIADTDWSGCDLVIEASGKMKTVAVLQAYLDQGVKRVVVVRSGEGQRRAERRHGRQPSAIQCRRNIASSPLLRARPTVWRRW